MATNLNTWAWSPTPADNATADASINWAEGQDPNTVNNSARSMMAAIKNLENVLSGYVAVGGSANAITIGTGQSISSGHQTLGFRLCFRANSTNSGATTVAVDGLSPVAIKRPNGDALSAGDIVSGAFHDIAFDGVNYKLLAAAGAAGAYGALSGDNTWTGGQNFLGNVYLGDLADSVYIKGTLVNAYMSGLLSISSVSALYAGIGLGTVATYNAGTSGATVPLLNASNTWSATQAMGSINTTGNIFIHAGGSAPLLIRNSDATSTGPYPMAVFQNAAGTSVGSITISGPAVPTTTAYNTTSDGRLKDLLGPVDDAGTLIDQLEPVYFTWKQGGGRTFGFIAQDVAQVLPEAVTPGNDKQPDEEGFVPWMMRVGGMEALLVAEIKALRARVAALEAG